MRLEYHFVSKGKLEAIDKRVNKIMSDWPDSSIQRFQLWEMVAALELGIADKIFYHKNTILCHGWNGYNLDSYHDNQPQDPYAAWGGFYRLDKGCKTYQFYLMWTKIESGELSTEEEYRIHFEGIINRRTLSRFGIWYWEDAPDYIWGFKAWKSWHHKNDAEAQLQEAKEKFAHLKRGDVEYCDVSGCYFCTIEVSVNKPDEVNWHNVVRTRIRR